VYLWIDVVVLAVIGVEGSLISVFHIAAFWGWTVNNAQWLLFFFFLVIRTVVVFFWTVNSEQFFFFRSN
jgi:hypothetical protein